MTGEAERWRRLEEVYGLVAGLARDDRAGRLDELCGDDAALRTEVEAMLGARDEAGAFLEAPLTSMLDDSDDLRGRTIGAWRIVERIGAGGMGTVYRAKRQDGGFEQQAALKLISGHGLGTDLRRRFRRERQILARLEHPNIARLIDGGVTEDGNLYLAMEYVDGRPLVEHCETNELGIDARLRLFTEVCGAVQHAHAQLVVHRDLKPANVLVTTDGIVKLLDFGIAAVLDDDVDRAEVTHTQQRRYTPQYASPEQVRGEPITTASDVYSLGLILYELLAGRRPYEVTGVSAQTDTALICDTMPPPPSRVLGVGADEARADAEQTRRMRRRLAGDLDRIVLMALRKEPERRYASVEQLIDDVRRHLDGRPVRAQPDTFRYRAGKFVGRNRVAVAAAAVVAVALVAAAVISLTFAVRESRQRMEAERQAAIANAVDRFLRVDLLGQADPHEEPDRDVTLRAVLDRAASAIGDRFADEPLVHAAVRSTLGTAYQGLGEYEAALGHHEAALASRRTVVGADHEETLASRHAIAGLYVETGRLDDAEAVLPALLRDARRGLGDGHRLTLGVQKHLAALHEARGDYEAAVDTMREVMDGHRRHLGPTDPDTLTATNDLALMLLDAGDLERAEPLLRDVLAKRIDVLGREHPDTILSLGSLGYLLTDAGAHEEAESVLREAVDISRGVLGSDHPRHAVYVHLLGSVQRERGRLEDALRTVGDALAIRRARLGVEHAETQMSLNLLATIHRDLGRYVEAERLFRETLEVREATLGEDHPSALIAMNNLADLLLRAGRPDEAESLAGRAVAGGRRAYPDDHWIPGVFLTNHGKALAEVGRVDDAERSLREARRILILTFDADHERVRKVDDLLERLRADRRE